MAPPSGNEDEWFFVGLLAIVHASTMGNALLSYTPWAQWRQHLIVSW